MILDGLKPIARTMIVSTIKRAGNLAQSSAGFKRFALMLLCRHPNLQQKLCNIYQQNQHDDQTQPINWHVSSTDMVMPLHFDLQGGKDMPQLARGINASQRTPLESSFHTYRGER